MQNNIFRVLALGDIVGSPGVNRFASSISELKRETEADFVVVNGENASDHNGLDVKSAEKILMSGADVITGGNHTINLKEIYNMLDDDQRLFRPANFPPLCPGKGWGIIESGSGKRVLVINISGQVYMQSCDNPFVCTEKILKEASGMYDIVLCDIHAEATSEKIAFSQYFDGKIACVFGTHTHVQTADESILPKGTGYITDLGMCGVIDGTVLGVKSDSVISRFVTGVNDKFVRNVSGYAYLNGALFEYDILQKRCVNVKRIKI